MHQTSTESQGMVLNYSRGHLHWAGLLFSHNFLLLVWRNRVGEINFPRFPRTIFTCMCLWPQSIKIRTGLEFAISHCQTEQEWENSPPSCLSEAASHPFSKLEWFCGQQMKQCSKRIKEIGNNAGAVSLGIILAFQRRNISYPECQGSGD